VHLSRAEGKTIGAPAAMTSISVQSVPSSVAVGPDGALYVGELTGVPFKPGTARVWRVVPGKKPTLYASGFTTISDLAFDGRDLLVLELSTRGLLAGRSPGALVRVAPNGTRRVLASKGLLYPTGVAVAGKTIYISNNGLFPATGSGPQGEIVSP
jgi:sugar lactone lactonase YvrE